VASTPVLWQIKVSHYNEKARWALDWKGVAHRRVTPMPLFGSLPAAWLMTRGITTPVLRLDGESIGDSTRIIAALERRHPTPPLYPADPAQRARALELEEFFDEQLAPYVRRLVWFHSAGDADAFLASAFPDSSRLVHAALRPGTVLAARAVKRRFGIDAATADEARGKVLAAMDRIEAEVGPSGYLVGDAFSVADLTGAALVTPLVRPPEREYLPRTPFPEPLASFCHELTARPAGQWVLETFRRHRRASAAV
jgi:glutathione S-transferase